MRGIIGYGAHVPFRRLDRGEIRAFLGTGGGKGTRAVASYDEDTTTMGVEAARLALASVAQAGPDAPDALYFSTVTPAYVDKTNATAIHAALRLDADVPAFDMGGAVRSGALRAALDGQGTVLVVAADIRGGLPASAEESAGGDAGVALLVGSGDEDASDPTTPTVIADFLGGASVTAEFLDRWRTPGEDRSKGWDEKFGEVSYVPLGQEAWDRALKSAGVTAEQVDRVVLAGPHSRALRSLGRRLGVADGALVDDLAGTIGWTGAAHPSLLLAATLDEAQPGQVIAAISLADGADVGIFRTTEAISSYRPARTVAEQVASAGKVSYAKFLTWRGNLTLEPPRRPEPARMSASAAGRSIDWKYGFVGSKDRTSEAIHLPPSRVSMVGGAVDDMEPVAMADVEGTIVTFTIDRLAYSPSPPVIFAVVDFDGGGRLPVELTDVDEADVAIGGRVEMTFRKLGTTDGIHNYFWKARPVRATGDPS